MTGVRVNDQPHIWKPLLQDVGIHRRHHDVAVAIHDQRRLCDLGQIGIAVCRDFAPGHDGRLLRLDVGHTRLRRVIILAGRNARLPCPRRRPGRPLRGSDGGRCRERRRRPAAAKPPSEKPETSTCSRPCARANAMMLDAMVPHAASVSSRSCSTASCIVANGHFWRLECHQASLHADDHFSLRAAGFDISQCLIGLHEREDPI